MNKIILVQLFVLLLLFVAMTDDKPAYKLYDRNGHETTYRQMLDSAKKADIVLFGELHDNPICHWLELELAKDMYKADSSEFCLGAEMIENDNRVTLNEYLNGFYNETTFKDNSRLWPNYSSDYRPLIEFAKTHKLKFIASDVPRRYAAMVSSKGLEFLQHTISTEAKGFMAPLPIDYDSTLKCYKDMLTMDPAHS